ncbi:transcriptional regulator NrdR [Rickettsiella grylli]|uniref:Transcriptional repressor NrdR n=1 Tax=Rickettsiella grylli TaxID=59196 RepID=A8PLC6_9COXI|nr:transcriptional regulator NrdR [Rickettsiella grylli]EDP45671.1 transcriptional regulator NrdR [Rickettsiella grylli]OIZ97948.1 transcriptional regulator NrdR [Rickettsiella grylli]
MYCPFCNEAETKVIDSRLSSDGQQVRRRRECLQCNERFSSFESADLGLPRVIKRDNTRSAFCQEKLRTGMLKALEKRPISSEQVEHVILRLMKKLRALGEREISSRQIGEWVMEELCDLDPVAYVRFASVYRSFQDIQAFNQAIEQLKQDISANKKYSHDTEIEKK